MKKIIRLLITGVIIIDSFVHLLPYVYPIHVTEQSCEIADTNELIQKVSGTEKIVDIIENPNQFIILKYNITVENPGKNSVFIEDYNIRVSSYQTKFFLDDVEFYDTYELDSSETDCLYGFIVLQKNNKKITEEPSEIAKKFKITLKYFIYLKHMILYAVKTQ